MTGDPKPDKFEIKDGAARADASSETDADLADQVERVVSLLHKLEMLYAQSPPRPEATGAAPARDEIDHARNELDDDFLERFAAGPASTPQRTIADQYTRVGTTSPHRIDRQPPPIPDLTGAPPGVDPAFWYKGALRQHDREVKPKPNLLTKVGFGVAAVLAVLLTLPWLVPAALGPDWRQLLAGVDPRAEGQFPPAKVAAPKVAAPQPKPVPVERAVLPKAPTVTDGLDDVAVLPDGEGDRSDAAADTQAVAARETTEVSPPPAPDAAPVPEEASKEEAWRMAALQAILDQRSAWRNAKETGNWSGIAQAPPVESRTFGEFDPPFSAADSTSRSDGGSRMAALDGGGTGGGVSTDAVTAEADTCESALVDSDQRAVRLSLADPSQKGIQTELVVNDISYRSAFGEDGRLTLEAPRLDETPVVRWVQRDGSVCQRTVPRPAGPSLLQVAVMWSGDLGLELDVVEPLSWPGSPSGYVTSLQPNTDGEHGAGSIRGFGRPGDPNRALVYAVATDDIGKKGVLNVQVKLSPRAEGGGTCGASAEVFTNAEILYEVYIVHDDGPQGKFRRENRSYAFKVPPCGATAAFQRIERLSVRF